MSYLRPPGSIRATGAYLGATALPVGLLIFLNLTRVQMSAPVDGPSVPHYGFPWRACAPGVNSLSIEVDLPLMLANLVLYLTVVCASFLVPVLRRSLLRLPRFFVGLLWAAAIVSAGYQSPTFLVGDLTFDLTDHVAAAGMRDQGLSFGLCDANEAAR